MYFAQRNFRKESFNLSFFWLNVTLSLAFAFGILQISGWISLNREGINVHQTSGAFIYLISGLHFLHIVVGLAGLIWIWLDSYPNRTYVEGFIQSLNPQKMARYKIVSILWHFLDLLWVGLFLLLWWQQNQP